jgi:glycine betaine/proline transport system ATP-binding protein
MTTSLKDVSRLFAEGASVLAFCDDKQQTVGFMRREKLGEALAAAEFGGKAGSAA